MLIATDFRVLACRPRRRAGRIRGAVCILGLAVLAGCEGGAALAPQVVVGPHGGTAYRLPGERGFAELVNEPEVDDARVAPTTALVVYFLQPDGKSPLTPAPSDVSARVMIERRLTTLPLKAEPKAGDPTGSARFATILGPYQLADLHGTLTATAGGETATIAFAAGR